MNRLFLGLAVTLLAVGVMGLVFGILSFANPYAGGGGMAWVLGSLGAIGAGLAFLFATSILDRLDMLAAINRELLATVRGDKRE
jgi:hypothetical protein